MENSTNQTQQLAEGVNNSSNNQDALPSKPSLSTTAKVMGAIEPRSLQAGLDNLMAVFRKIKPFVLTKLVRDLIDAQTRERFFMTLIAFLDLYSEYLPSTDDISTEAVTCAWKFFKYCKQENKEPVPAEDDDTFFDLANCDIHPAPHYHPQGFVKTEDTPDLDALCNRLGINSKEIKNDFRAMEIPIAILSGLLGAVALFMGDKIAGLFLDPRSLKSNLASTASMIKNTTVVWSAFGTTWETIMNFIGGFFGYTYISSKDARQKEALERIIKIKEKFVELTDNMTINLSNIIQSDEGLAQIEREVQELDKLITRLMSDKVNVDSFRPYLVGFQRNIDAMRKVIRDVKTNAAGKVHPVVLYLSGDAGIGKSKCAHEIINRLSIREGRSLSVYTRNTTDKYYSSYAYQDVVLYDDFGQDKENTDHGELINIYSPASYLLNMSNDGDKGRPFTSRYIICCSNQDYIHTSSKISDLNALNRRRDWLYHVEAGDDLAEYKRTNNDFPPSDSNLWKADFKHLKLNEWKRLNLGREDDRLIRENVDLDTVVDEVYNLKIRHERDYENKLIEAAATKTYFNALHELFHIEVEPERVQRTLEERDRRRQAFDDRVARIVDALPPALQQDELVNEIVGQVRRDHADALANDMNPQSIVSVPTGVNQYLLLGPSGCGKSHMMKQMNPVVVHTPEEVFNPDGTIKGGDHTNFHVEDCSITAEATDHALMICQRLSDHQTFRGNCVVSANPDMLFKNLENRGEEATEVFTRRCTIIRIIKRTQRFAIIRGDLPNASVLGEHDNKYCWDDLYYAIKGDNTQLNFTELQLLLMKNERSIRTYAVFDMNTLEDFHNQEVVQLTFKGLDWEGFKNMEDYSGIKDYLTVASMARAVRYLRSYVPVLQGLPRNYATPIDMVNLMNRGTFRVAESTPSARLTFDDFEIALINHKTYCLVQLKTQDKIYPNFEITPTQTPSKQHVDFDKKAFFKLLLDFGLLIGGGTLIIRELCGFNQGKDIIMVDPESRKSKKAMRKEVKKHLIEVEEETDSESEFSDHKQARSVVPRRKKADPSPGAMHSGTQQHYYENEARVSKAKKRKEARSVVTKGKKPDPSPGAGKTNTTIHEYDNECKTYVDIYSHDIKQPEGKILTMTDLEPRYSVPDYDNVVDITEDSPYHVKYWRHILKPQKPIRSQFAEFEHYFKNKNLDYRILYCQGVTFQNADTGLQTAASEFLQTAKHINLEPESMADPQAASLIPILEKNQVYIYNGNNLSQRALMVKGHIGVSVMHGMDGASLLRIPGDQTFYTIKILREEPERDRTIFQVSKKCKAFKDITHFIRSIKDTEILDGVDCFLLTVHSGNAGIITRVQASKIGTEKEVRYLNKLHRGYTYAGTVTGFHLPLPSLTEKGYCGSPTVICNTRYMRKIISIHAAGNDTSAFGIPIYREDFVFALEPESICMPTVRPVALKHQELTPIEPREVGGGFTALFELNHHNSAPVQTNIFRSPLATERFGDNFEPAILANYDDRNIDGVDIAAVTIEKWNRKQPENLDEECLDWCVDQWANYFAQIVSQNQLPQYVLTKTEAINRTTRYGSSQPIPRDTSSGYPWKHRPGAKGKELFIQPRAFGDTVIQCIPNDQNGRDLHNAVDELIRTTEKGLRPAVVFSSSAKDEVVKKKKIYPCRTRGFAGAPIDYTIAHRMYFHTAICSLIETRKEHPVKVGIEANGVEWDELYKYLADNSTVGFDVDFKDWDATIPLTVMKKLYRIYNAMYSANPYKTEDIEKDNRIRQGLHSVLWGPLLTYGQYVVAAPGGQVSGQPATTIDNCFVGLIIQLYVWMKTAPEGQRNFACFIDNVRSIVYGDDGAVTVKPDALKFYNMPVFCKIVQEQFGMEATPASKEDESRDFKPLIEIEFLKRNFIKIGRQYFGKIQPTVFDKMLNWTHTYRRHHFFREKDRVHFDLATIEASVDSLLFEYCVYPKQKWAEMVRHISARIRRLGSKKILPTQEDTLEKRGIPHKLFNIEQ